LSVSLGSTLIQETYEHRKSNEDDGPRFSFGEFSGYFPERVNFNVRQTTELLKQIVDQGAQVREKFFSSEAEDEWMEVCRCLRVPDHNQDYRTEEAMDPYSKSVGEMIKTRDFRAAMPPKFGTSGKLYLQCLASKVELINGLGAPRVKVVRWRDIKRKGELLKFPDDEHLIIDLEALLQEWLTQCDPKGELNGCVPLIVMASHKWDRPHWCKTCAKGAKCKNMEKAHPDTKDHNKAKTIALTGEELFDRGFDTFYWMDYGSIDQQDLLEKKYGIASMAMYASCCEQLHIFEDAERKYWDRAWPVAEQCLAYQMIPNDYFLVVDMQRDYSEGNQNRPMDKDHTLLDLAKKKTTVDKEKDTIKEIVEAALAIDPLLGSDSAWTDLKIKPALGASKVTLRYLGMSGDSNLEEF